VEPKDELERLAEQLLQIVSKARQHDTAVAGQLEEISRLLKERPGEQLIEQLLLKMVVAAAGVEPNEAAQARQLEEVRALMKVLELPRRRTEPMDELEQLVAGIRREEAIRLFVSACVARYREDADSPEYVAWMRGDSVSRYWAAQDDATQASQLEELRRLLKARLTKTQAEILRGRWVPEVREFYPEQRGSGGLSLVPPLPGGGDVSDL